MVRRKPEPREEAKPVRPERTGPIEPPPTIGSPKAHGLAGLRLSAGGEASTRCTEPGDVGGRVAGFRYARSGAAR